MPDSRIETIADIKALTTKINDILRRYPELYALVDVNILNLYPHLFDRFDPNRIIPIPSGESSKSMQRVEKILTRLLALEASRKCYLLGIGGGVTSDITGFVASIYKRGIHFSLVPTTLLGMVDAAIGGKNGLDMMLDDPLDKGKKLQMKNIVGTFKQPEAILECSEFLDTLPLKEIRSGEAELIKELIIGDAKAYESAVPLLKKLSADNDSPEFKATLISTLEPFIPIAAAIKENICKEDPLDLGKRHVLNLGHTYGHAFEETYPDRFTHGGAIALGILQALDLGVSSGFTPPEVCDRISDDIYDLGLITVDIKGLDSKDISLAIANDKKAEGDKIAYVFVRALGDVIPKDVPLNLFKLRPITI